MAKFDLHTIRHSAAHVMAAAVKRLYPGTRFDIGPATDNGFYYDFDLEKSLSEDDLKTIEEEMKKIVNSQEPFVKHELTREEAEKMLREDAQDFKLERLEDIPEDEEITFYQCAGFIDLCRGPHVEHTGQIGAFKLLSIAGSYYRGLENNPMLQRIYGTAFPTKKELNAYLHGLEEARKRDHRKLGRELELFSTSDTVGPGLICWHPKGARIRHIIETFWREQHYENGYDLLYTPHIGKADLWQTSGHLEFYDDAMYAPLDVDGYPYYVKPMNCPFHIQVYKSRNRSYRELPLRWAELGTVYRYEKGGVLHGLLRVRGFTQDDAHIICTPAQVKEEIAKVLRFSLFMWRAFGFEDVKAYLATRPEKAVGETQHWDDAVDSLRSAVEQEELECEVEEGGGAFYGPKIDLKIKDALGREWQTSTIQFDFNLPERFDMTYIGDDGQKHRPYMIHRALLGSIERFFGILTEHYGGVFPAWLAPEQGRILPVSDNFIEYAHEVEKQLKGYKLRVEVDKESDTIGAKIRRARNDGLLYMLIVGEKEESGKKVAVRKRGEGQLGTMSVNKFADKLIEEARILKS
ncbi:MAG: threonine--tRNA ligase [Verrucomicrobiota bacterium]